MPSQYGKTGSALNEIIQTATNPNRLPTTSQFIELHNAGLLPGECSGRQFWGLELSWRTGTQVLFRLGEWETVAQGDEPLILVDGLPWDYLRTEDEVINLRKKCRLAKYHFYITNSESAYFSVSHSDSNLLVRDLYRSGKLALPDCVGGVSGATVE